MTAVGRCRRSPPQGHSSDRLSARHEALPCKVDHGGIDNLQVYLQRRQRPDNLRRHQADSDHPAEEVEGGSGGRRRFRSHNRSRRYDATVLVDLHRLALHYPVDRRLAVHDLVVGVQRQVDQGYVWVVVDDLAVRSYLRPSFACHLGYTPRRS